MLLAIFDKIKPCLNKCIFCFVDQQPKGLRKTLYIKDDDYRLSYLQGTYITLTNINEKDKKRLEEQRLGPLYVSVHTTNPELRAKMLRNKRASEIMNNLKWLSDNDIPIHTQIVLCPGYNDNEELTPEELKSKIDDLSVKALDPEYQAEVLGQCLNEFYKSKVPVWLIPVAIVMEARGFFPDVLDLVEQDIVQGYKNEAPDYYMPMWNELIDKAVAESIAIEIDPQQGLRELNIYCKNLTDLDINQVYIRIDVLSNLNAKQSFIVPLLSQSYLRNREEKHIQVKCPDDISIANAVEITHRVESLEFTK